LGYLVRFATKHVTPSPSQQGSHEPLAWPADWEVNQDAASLIPPNQNLFCQFKAVRRLDKPRRLALVISGGKSAAGNLPWSGQCAECSQSPRLEEPLSSPFISIAIHFINLLQSNTEWNRSGILSDSVICTICRSNVLEALGGSSLRFALLATSSYHQFFPYGKNISEIGSFRVG
jgi:hypothetical protein